MECSSCKQKYSVQLVLPVTGPKNVCPVCVGVYINETYSDGTFTIVDGLRPPAREMIFELIDEERLRQDHKWGCQLTEFGEDLNLAQVILVEEVGEVSRAILDRNLVNLREETIQVAAVAVKLLEALQ